MEGTISQIGKWGNGKGFFFRIREAEGSFFAYGNPPVMGEIVSFDTTQKAFNGALEAKFKKHEKQIEAYVDEDKPRSASIREHDAPRTSAIPNRDDVITRLACIKAAAEISKTAEEAIGIARKFEAYAKGEKA